MSAFNCPFCNHGMEENYDDQDSYEDGNEEEIECTSCGKKIIVTTSVSISWDAACAEHEWGEFERFSDNPRYEEHNKKMEKHYWCKNCGCAGDEKES